MLRHSPLPPLVLSATLAIGIALADHASAPLWPVVPHGASFPVGVVQASSGWVGPMERRSAYLRKP